MKRQPSEKPRLVVRLGGPLVVGLRPLDDGLEGDRSTGDETDVVTVTETDVEVFGPGVGEVVVTTEVTDVVVVGFALEVVVEDGATEVTF